MVGEAVTLPFKYQSFAATASPAPGPAGHDRVTRGALPEIILAQKSISVLFHNVNTSEPARCVSVVMLCCGVFVLLCCCSGAGAKVIARSCSAACRKHARNRQLSL